MLLYGFYLYSLVCGWLQCEAGMKPPYVNINLDGPKKLLSPLREQRGREGRAQRVRGPTVNTKLGLVEGYIGKNTEGRDIYMFTGVPYAEPPTGQLRFRSPAPKKPWKGTVKATSPSPFCIQVSLALQLQLRGQEDCLYLEIHTPKLPTRGKKGKLLPVFVWVPAGAYIWGRSLYYGSDKFMREDVIVVPINVRWGILGYLSTGDAASPGNWGLKDQAMAVQWVYENIEAFGGDPNHIIIGGISSGSESAHSMLFTNLKVRDHLAGVVGISGSFFAHNALDITGRVREASDISSERAGCPTSRNGSRMVECLRKLDPYMLSMHQFQPMLWELPPLSKTWGPVLEPDLPGAYVTELPEVMYEKGEVPPIPLMLTRTMDETNFFTGPMRYNLLMALSIRWFDWMPKILTLAVRNTKVGEKVTEKQAREYLLTLMRFYFGKDTPPNLRSHEEYTRLVQMFNDAFFYVPTWTGLELHNKIAPNNTFSYLFRTHYPLDLNRWVKFAGRVMNAEYGGAHSADFMMIFNNTKGLPSLPPGSDMDVAARNLINMLVNFGEHGKPLYRTKSGELLDIWKPIGSIDHMMVLDIGLVNNISMIYDPLPPTGRRKIWEKVKF